MSANLNGVGKLGWKDREAICAEVLGLCRNVVSVIGFQESPWDMSKIQKALGENWNFILGEKDEDLSANTIAYDNRIFRCEESSTFWQSEDGSHKKDWDGIRARATSWARFLHLPSGRDFLFLNSHLDNVGIEARRQGTLQNLSVIQSYSGLPVIFAADMNISIHSPFPRHKDPVYRRWNGPVIRAPYDLMLNAGFTDCSVEPFRNDRNPAPKRSRTFNDYLSLEQYRAMQGDDYGLWDPDYILVLGFRVRNYIIKSSYHEGGAYSSDHDWPVAELDFA